MTPDIRSTVSQECTCSSPRPPSPLTRRRRRHLSRRCRPPSTHSCSAQWKKWSIFQSGIIPHLICKTEIFASLESQKLLIRIIACPNIRACTCSFADLDYRSRINGHGRKFLGLQVWPWGPISLGHSKDLDFFLFSSFPFLKIKVKIVWYLDTTPPSICTWFLQRRAKLCPLSHWLRDHSYIIWGCFGAF